MQSQHNSASCASMGANDLASYVLDQITDHNGNTEFKDNNCSQSFETPR